MNLSKKEKEIINYIENKNPKSVPNLKNEIQKYTNLAKIYMKKNKIAPCNF